MLYQNTGNHRVPNSGTPRTQTNRKSQPVYHFSLLLPPTSPTKIPKTRTIMMENIDEQNIEQEQNPVAMFPAGNQPPKPLVVTPKEIKMNTLTPFTGDRAKLDNFLMEVEMYMWMNSSVYDTNEKKILFALSFMKDGMAGPWKQSFWNSIDFDNAQHLGSWKDFKRALRESFSLADKVGDALTKMMTEVMGTRTADEYIKDFKIWAVKSGITENIPLIEWFSHGLNTRLRDKILNLKNIPDSFNGWFIKVSKLDNQY